MLGLCLTLALAVAPPPLSLAMPELQVVHIEAKAAAFYSEHLAQHMKFPGVQLSTTREITAMLGQERNRQLLGCSDGTSVSCITELANALGAEALVLGDLARDGASTQVNLKIVSVARGATLATFSGRATGEAALLDLLTHGAHEVLIAAHRSLGRPAPEALLVADQSVFVRTWWAPGAAGLVLAGAGAALTVLAQRDYQTLKSATADAPLSREVAATALNRGRVAEPVGVACLALGAASLAASVALLVVHRVGLSQDAPVVSLAPLPGGGFLALSGRFP